MKEKIGMERHVKSGLETKNYLDFNEKDCARELAERVRAFELFPTHSASMKLIS